MMGMEEKPRNTKKMKQRKNFPFGCPPIPPSTKWRPTVFQCLKTSWTYPKWEKVLNLMGEKKRQGWVWYGQLMTGNMDFVHVKFKYLQ